MGDEGFERYMDEFVEACAHLIQLVAQLRQLPPEDPNHDLLETEFYGMLAHIKEHSTSLSDWIDELIDFLPDK